MTLVAQEASKPYCGHSGTACKTLRNFLVQPDSCSNEDMDNLIEEDTYRGEKEAEDNHSKRKGHNVC